jgi:hypothetical protein
MAEMTMNYKMVYTIDKSKCKNPVYVKKINPNAEIPYKDEGEVAWNIDLIGRTDNRIDDVSHDINEFNTGLVISPPSGFYVEVVASQNLYSSGYTLPYNLIINPNNTEELIVPLYKFRDTSELDFPFQGVKFVLREFIDAYVTNAPQQQPQQPQYQQQQPPQYQQQYQQPQYHQPQQQDTSRVRGRKPGGNTMF